MRGNAQLVRKSWVHDRPAVGAVYDRPQFYGMQSSALWAVVEGVNELENRDIPSLNKEGCREAAGWFDQEINYWTNTTPALRATPPQLRRGVFRTRQFHIFIDRPYRGTLVQP